MICPAKTLYRTVHQIFKIKDTLIQTTAWIYFWNYQSFSEHLCQLQKEKVIMKLLFYMKKNYVNMDRKHVQMAFYLVKAIFAGSPVCRATHFHGAGWTQNHSTDTPQWGEKHHPAAAASQQGVVSYRPQLHWTARSYRRAIPLKPLSPYVPSTGCAIAEQHLHKSARPRQLSWRCE